jgi:hypothetical protein
MLACLLPVFSRSHSAHVDTFWVSDVRPFSSPRRFRMIVLSPRRLRQPGPTFGTNSDELGDIERSNHHAAVPSWKCRRRAPGCDR